MGVLFERIPSINMNLIGAIMIRFFCFKYFRIDINIV